MTRLQLQVYAAGYQKAVGKDADLIEIHNLEMGHIHREEVEASVVQETLNRVMDAGKRIRNLNLPKLDTWCDTCRRCDMAGICRTREV